MSLTSTGNRCRNNGQFPVKLLNILSTFLFLVISIRKWIELYYLINWWRSNFKMWANGWPAAAAENNLNSAGQTEAGFQRTFKSSPDCCSRINPYHRGRRGLSGALLPVTHLGSWRSTCLRGQRWEQGWDYPSAPPCTLPESNLKLSSCPQLFFVRWLRCIPLVQLQHSSCQNDPKSQHHVPGFFMTVGACWQKNLLHFLAHNLFLFYLFL